LFQRRSFKVDDNPDLVHVEAHLSLNYVELFTPGMLKLLDYKLRHSFWGRLLQNFTKFNLTGIDE